MKTLRYAVVGIGNMGSAHAMQLFEGHVEGARLTAVCDISEEKLSFAREKFASHVAYYTDYKELLEDHVCDAIIIATPHYSHTKIATDAFRANLHVLCEKPAGVRAIDVERMNKEANAATVSFGIMFNQRMNPVYGALKYYVELGVLGEIKRFVWIINNWYRTEHYYDSAGWRATWHGEGGGVLINQAPHNLDLWQWIMGMPVTLRAFCKEGKYHHIDVEDDATLYAEYENGATATFITSTGEYPGTNRLEISGTMGKAVCEDGKINLYLLDEDERDIRMHSPIDMPTEKVTHVQIVCKSGKEEHLQVIQNFTNHILNGEKLIAPGTDGIYSLMLSNAAYLSSWKKKTVSVPVSGREFAIFLKRKKDVRRQIQSIEASSQLKCEYNDRWKVRW